jgi:hypothetical protein
MKSTIGKLSVFLLLIAGIFGYLKTGVDLFEKIKNGAINMELKSIDRYLTVEFNTKGKYPTHFKKFMSEYFDTRTNKKTGTDPWGNDYYYSALANGYTIVSNGPNETFGDMDDVVLVRDNKNFSINVGAASVDLKSLPTKPLMNSSPKKSVILEDLMEYLEISKLERPFEEISDEDLAKHISKFLRDYGYE